MKGISPRYAAAASLTVLIIINAVIAPNFATMGNLWNVLLQVSPVLLCALGMTFVIATGGVDLSVGSVMAIASAVMAVTATHGPVIALCAAVLGAGAVGALNGAVTGSFGVQPIIVTLATLIAGRGLAQVISHDGELVTVASPALVFLGRGHVGPVPMPVIAALSATIVAAFVLRETTLGRYVLAVGGNRAAARLAGVPVRLSLVTVYVASACLSALAGFVVTAQLGASDAAKVGQNMELDAIAAVVVGGTALAGGRATIVGTVVGALMMQVIATSFNMLLVPYAWSLAFKALIILVAVYLQREARA